MTTPHKATPEQWQLLKARAADPMYVVAACVQELYDRLEALEGKYETQRLATWECDSDELLTIAAELDGSNPTNQED